MVWAGPAQGPYTKVVMPHRLPAPGSRISHYHVPGPDLAAPAGPKFSPSLPQATRTSRPQMTLSVRRFAIALAGLLVAISLSAQSPAPAKDSATKKKTAPDTDLPILPTRNTAFTTDEGTWMSLDVSPDGKSIVFDLMGDLYTLPLSGGKASRITSGMGFDGQPKFSPDGKSIVFVSDRSGYENLSMVDADGKNIKALTKDKDAQYLSPTFTPDGKYLVVSRNKQGVLGSRYDLVMLERRWRHGGQAHRTGHRPRRRGGARQWSPAVQ